MRRRVAAIATAFLATPAFCAPIAVTCNGLGLDPRTGRQAVAGTMTLGFEFDQSAQRMAVTRGAPSRIELLDVRISDSMASGSDGKWVYEINRIDGTATLRADLKTDYESERLGLGGNYFKGTCARAGTAKF